jgi:hypothetical protein
MVVLRHNGKYIVYSDDGHVLVITRYKNVARQIIEDYKNDKSRSVFQPT